MSTALETMVNELGNNGMAVDFKKRMNDGTYENASSRDLSLLNAQASISETANFMHKLSKQEKLEKALELKEEGNNHFKHGDYKLALDVYLQALSASDFGKTPPSSNSNTTSSNQSHSICSDTAIATSNNITTNNDSVNNNYIHTLTTDNIDSLVVPVLCNMAACCLHLHEYVKVAKFCEQVLILRPHCLKALIRSGIAFYYLKEHQMSIHHLEQAQQQLLLSSPSTSSSAAAAVPLSTTSSSSSSILSSTVSTLNSTSNGTTITTTTTPTTIQDSTTITTTSSSASSNNNDISKVNYYLIKAKKERQEEKERLKQQKLSLQRAFGTGPYSNNIYNNNNNNNSGSESTSSSNSDTSGSNGGNNSSIRSSSIRHGKDDDVIMTISILGIVSCIRTIVSLLLRVIYAIIMYRYNQYDDHDI